MDEQLIPRLRKNVKDITGLKFGRLSVIRYIGVPEGERFGKWLCRCSCGNETKSRATFLVNGNTASCGCLRIDSTSSRNGASRKRHYKRWRSMILRCSDPSVRSYPGYGGRGISVCERWMNYETFESDIGVPPSPKHSLHRIDNNGPYSPENCRWADDFEQANSTRHNRPITFNGKTLNIGQWAREIGIPIGTLSRRLNIYKWPLEKALTQQLRALNL